MFALLVVAQMKADRSYLSEQHLQRGFLTLWSWIPGLLVFCFGALELMRWWSPSWDYSPNRWQYAVRNLLTSNCGSTECLDELFYTMPFVCSIAYSVASYYVLRRTRQLQRAIVEGSAANSC